MRQTASLILLTTLASLSFGCQSNPKKDAIDKTIDPFTLVKAPHKFRKLVDPKVGYKIVYEINNRDGNDFIYFSIVGETDKSWRIEYVAHGLPALKKVYPILKGHLLGIVLNKSDLKVTEAYIGKPGEKPKAIEINPPPQPINGEPEKRKIEKIKIPLGEFTASRTELLGLKMWYGTEGQTKGILLKSMWDDEPNDHLEKIEANESVFVGADKVKVVKMHWTRDDEKWYINHPVVNCFSYRPHLGRSTIMTRSGSSYIKLIGLKTDAKAELKWD